MATTTTTQVSPATQAYYDRKLLTRARPKLIALDFGQTRELPAKNSATIKFRRYGAFPVATTPLTEGTLPESTQLSITDITATVQQYGAYVKVTDVVELIVEDNVLNEATDLCSDQLADTVDTLAMTALAAGTNVFYANGVADRASLASTVKTTDFDKVIRALRRNNASEFTDMIKASTGVSTTPVRPAYWCIVHPDVAADIEKLDGFISVEKYANVGGIHSSEIGAYKNIRFVMTTQAPYVEASGNPLASTFVPCEGTGLTAKARVYQCVILAQNAYGIIDITKGNVESMIKTPGPQSTENALNQWSTVGWKTWFTTKILNDAWMARIECLASA